MPFSPDIEVGVPAKLTDRYDILIDDNGFSSITITTDEGLTGSGFGGILLKNGGMPLGSFSRRMVLEKKITNYREGVSSAQVTATKEVPIRIRGQWRTFDFLQEECARISSGGQEPSSWTIIENPLTLVKELQTWFLRGVVVQLKWGPNQIVGLLSDFGWSQRRPDEVSWSLEVEVLRSERVWDENLTIEVNPVSEAQSFLDQLKEAKDVITSPAEYISKWIDQGEMLLSNVSEAVETADRCLNTYLGLATRTVNLGHQAVNIVNQVLVAVEELVYSLSNLATQAGAISLSGSDFYDRVSGTDVWYGSDTTGWNPPVPPFSGKSGKPTPTSTNGSTEYSQGSQAYALTSGQSVQADAFFTEASGTRAQLEVSRYYRSIVSLKISASRVVSSFEKYASSSRRSFRSSVLPVGTDLRKVSLKAYGSPDRWVEIADYNDIEGSILQRTTVVRIPR